MSRILNRKRVVLGIVAALAITAAAYAYWTTSGSGSGTATAGTDKGVTVAGDPADGIYPSGNVAVSTVITNSSATQPQYVKNLHVSISNDKSGTGCSNSWFTYKADADAVANVASNPHTSPVDYDIPAGGTKTVAGKVFMSNETSSQDACKGAKLTLTYGVDNNAS
jgi:hypothetical protein